MRELVQSVSGKVKMWEKDGGGGEGERRGRRGEGGEARRGGEQGRGEGGEAREERRGEGGEARTHQTMLTAGYCSVLNYW